MNPSRKSSRKLNFLFYPPNQDLGKFCCAMHMLRKCSEASMQAFIKPWSTQESDHLELTLLMQSKVSVGLLLSALFAENRSENSRCQNGAATWWVWKHSKRRKLLQHDRYRLLWTILRKAPKRKRNSRHKVFQDLGNGSSLSANKSHQSLSY